MHNSVEVILVELFGQSEEAFCSWFFFFTFSFIFYKYQTLTISLDVEQNCKMLCSFHSTIHAMHLTTFQYVYTQCTHYTQCAEYTWLRFRTCTASRHMMHRKLQSRHISSFAHWLLRYNEHETPMSLNFRTGNYEAGISFPLYTSFCVIKSTKPR